MKPKIGLEWIAAILLLLSGSVLTFLTPFLQIPDEPAHLCRAFQISEGILLSPVAILDNGRKTLTAEVPDVFTLKKYTANPFSGDKRYSFDDIKFLMSAPTTNRHIVYISNTGQYSPLVYFPQALAAYIARSLGAVTAGQIFYSMRFGAVLFVTLCIFLSIRLYPEKGLLIFLLSMLPVFLAESASLAADAATYGICFVTTSYLLALGRNKSFGQKQELWAETRALGRNKSFRQKQGKTTYSPNDITAVDVNSCRSVKTSLRNHFAAILPDPA